MSHLRLVKSPPLSPESGVKANQEFKKKTDEVFSKDSENPGWLEKIGEFILTYREEIMIILGVGAIISVLAHKVPSSLDQDIQNDHKKAAGYQAWLKKEQEKNYTK